jgi:flagellar motor switch protein FliM
MSEPQARAAILTREELDALLASLREGSREAAGEGVPFFPALAAASDAESVEAYTALQRALEQFALDQTRHYSNIYQARIEFAVLGWQISSLARVSETLLDSDRIALIEFSPSGARGFVWLGRPLLFALLSLVFGAQPGAFRFPCPQRPYTGIERRIFRRSVEEMLAQLNACWAELSDARARIVGIQSASVLRERAEEESLLLATLEVRGLGDLCRLRLGLPAVAFRGLHEAPLVAPSGEPPAVESAVREMPIELRVEVGSVALSLAQLAELEAGSVVPIDTAQDGSLLVRVEGRPKFRAIRGTLGPRVAVQLTERIPVGEVGDGGRG